jgi:hypothetical protein
MLRDFDLTSINGVDCLTRVEAWLPAKTEPVNATVHHLRSHRPTDVWQLSIGHPRW